MSYQLARGDITLPREHAVLAEEHSKPKLPNRPHSFYLCVPRKVTRGENTKEYRCILVGHHDNVGQTIQEWEQQGWKLHTYNTAGMGGTYNYTVNHYLLFVRGE